MLAEFDRVIVVDWSCPQGSGRWAESEGAEVVYQKGEKYWEAACARNLGARHVQTRKVCFLDADTMVFPGLKAELESLMSLQTMVLSSRNPLNFDVPNLSGFIALDIGQFWGVKGYDETIRGYGAEDMMLRARLCLERGLKVKRVSPDTLGAIQHSNEIRSKFHEKPIRLTSQINLGILYEYLASQGVYDFVNDPRTRDIAYRCKENTND
jgi:hypothetical protein